ncbi:MAG TPA: hypothetical protein VKB69_06515 [Micromonosporaceae bacterium]|nr:hypothetical protein [Micromonosporaceae bacterium]
MNTCVQCGSALVDQARFCQHCGWPVDAPPPAPPAGGSASAWATSPDYPLPSPAVPRSPAVTPAARPNFAAFLSGDWPGAILAVTVGVLAMAAYVLVLMLVNFKVRTDVQPLPGGSFLVGLTAIYTAMASGGSLEVTTHSAFEAGTASVSYQMLGPALIGYALIGWIFVRRLRRAGTPTFARAATQACRCLLVLLLELLAVALLSHVGTDIEGEDVHADVVTTLFYGALTLAVFLAIASILGLRGIASARAERVRTVIAGPLRAVVVLFGLSMAASLIALLVLVAREMNADPPADVASTWWSLAVSLALLLPNAAAIALPFGLGAPVNYNLGGGGFGSDNFSRSATVLDLLDRDNIWWLWPVIAVLLMLLTGYLAGRWSPSTVNGRSMAPMLGVVFPAVLLVLAVVSSGDLGGFTTVVPIEVSAGLNIPLAIVFGAIWGLFAGLIGMAMVGRRPVPPPPYIPQAPPPAPAGVSPWHQVPVYPTEQPPAPAYPPDQGGPGSRDIWGPGTS